MALFLFVIFLSACQEKTSQTATTAVEDAVDVGEKISEKTIKNFIPVVNFEALAPLLSKKNDTLYVINFWATWCKPCVKEMPYFEKIHTDYASQKVKVILVSLDFPDKLESQVLPFLENRKMQSQVVLLDDPDANTWIPKVSPEWSGGIPATVIYRNTDRKFYEKSFTFEELETEIQTFL